MDLKAAPRRMVRYLFESVLPARPRFHALRLAVRILPSQVGPGAFLRLAPELVAAGRVREAMLCWRILHRMAPADTNIALQRISTALEAGAWAEVDRALDDSAQGAGLPPRGLVRFAGELAWRGDARNAGQILIRMAGMVDCDRLAAQAPSFVAAASRIDILALGTQLAAAGTASAHDLLSVARLCFTFRNPRVASLLFARAASVAPLGALDRIAMMHAAADGDDEVVGSADERRALTAQLSGDPDALGAIAKVAVMAGELDVADEALRLALHIRHGGSSYEHAVLADCRAILRVLAGLRDVDEALPAPLLERASAVAGGIPKVFVCGFGWSGSGALYDAIRGVPGFCEFEGAGCDSIINEGADSEVMFVQGAGGLGDIWKSALENGKVPWSALWNTFSLHVMGLSPIGYAQYKSCGAARNQLRRYGAAYTGPFRRFLEKYAKIRRQPHPGALHASLLEATEALCSMLVHQTGARAVLFNNAIFGRGAVMLEIFRSHRAAIVYRDPRDVYVDRRDNDRNHWRNPAQLATFYAHGLQRYIDYRQNRRNGDPSLREVRFERFVECKDFRGAVRKWLLWGMADDRGSMHFDPAASRRNIGIHLSALQVREQSQLEPAMDASLTLDWLSSLAWAGKEPPAHLPPTAGLGGAPA